MLKNPCSLSAIRFAPPLGQVIVLGLLVSGLLFTPAAAQPDGVFTQPESYNVREHLADMENQVYGRQYQNDPLIERIRRLEVSLLGARQAGSTEERYHRLANYLSLKNRAEELHDQIPLVEYLEQKLFRQTHDKDSLPQRLARLEQHMFGEPMDDYPLDIRIKKLTYAMPIVTRNIQLATGGVVVASTARQTKQPAYNTPGNDPVETMVLKDPAGGAISAVTPSMPNGMPISTGDYFHNIFKHESGTLLRWQALPVNVFIRADNERTETLTRQAVSRWSRLFRFELVDNSADADVIVNWQARTHRQIYPLINTVIHLNRDKQIRTVVLVNASVLREQPDGRVVRTLSHQLGHAAGLWGHSDEPNDLMFPVFEHEYRDIPVRWLRRSPVPSPLIARQVAQGTLDYGEVPSQRDINTLTRIYQTPAVDLRRFNPY